MHDPTDESWDMPQSAPFGHDCHFPRRWPQICWSRACRPTGARPSRRPKSRFSAEQHDERARGSKHRCDDEPSNSRSREPNGRFGRPCRIVQGIANDANPSLRQQRRGRRFVDRFGPLTRADPSDAARFTAVAYKPCTQKLARDGPECPLGVANRSVGDCASMASKNLAANAPNGGLLWAGRTVRQKSARDPGPRWAALFE